MNAVTHKTLWAHLFALLALGLFACPPAVEDDGGTGGGTTEGCSFDTDCGETQYFRCNKATFTCEPTCRRAEHCNDRPAGAELDHCGGELGCQCDEGRCAAALCGDDSACGSLVCRNGECVTPPTEATSCEVSPSFVVLGPGTKQKFHVSGWSGTNPVVIKDGAAFTATAGAGTIDTSGVFTAGSAAFAEAVAVTATYGGASCTAKAIVLAAPAAVGIVVIDELSGHPVQGAHVVVSAANGDIVQQGGADYVDTDASGYADLDVTSGQSVTVLHADYTYLTIANYTGASAGKLLSAVVRRNQVDKHGGFKGVPQGVPNDTNVKAFIGGMSIAGNITGLNLTQLLGPSVNSDIAIGTFTQNDVPLPAGIFLQVGTGGPSSGPAGAKGQIAGLGLAGTCGDETKEKAGTCGTRSMWGLGGGVSIGQLPIADVVGLVGGGSIDGETIGNLLAGVLPLFSNFNSTVVRDITFELKDTSSDGGVQDLTDNAHYTAATFPFSQVPLAFNVKAKMPNLPQFNGKYADAVAVIAGVNSVGRGVVPLGIGIGVNTGTVDAEVDALGETEKGHVGVRLAPAHHGLEGSEYGLLVAAISASSLTDAAAGGLGLSATFPRIDGLVFNETYDVSGVAFPGFPENAVINFGTRSVTLPAVSGTQVIRVSFSSVKETRWDVLVASSGTVAFTLPAIPTGLTLTDRFFGNGTNSRSSATVQAFSLTTTGRPAGTALTFNDYVEHTGYGLDTTHYLTAFSLQSYSPPEIDLNLTGTTVKAEVSGVSIATGNHGLTFTYGGDCAGPAGPLREDPAGSNEVSIALTAACTGSVTATLVDAADAALVPGISKTLNIP